MTDEEIKAMVREAGFVPDWAVENCHEQFKRLVAFVAERAAAAEREACAKVCDEKSAKVLSMQMGNDPHDLPNVMLRHQSVAHLEDAAAIRARGAK